MPDAAKARLAWAAPRVPPETAASDDEVLIVGGVDAAEGDGKLQLPDSALRVDPAAGTATELPAPGGDAPINVIDAAADDSGFVVVGTRCDEEGFGIGDYECDPGSGASYRLDAASGTWHEVVLAPEVSPTQADAPWVFQPVLGLAPDGRVFMVVRSGPADGSGDLPFRLLVLDGDRWVHAAELSTDLVVDACATSDGVYALVSEPGATVTEGPPPPATLRLVTVSLDGGAPVPVELPAIDTSMGGAAVAMACDKRGPYVTSSRPDPTAELELYALRGGEWGRITGDWGNALPLEVYSAAEGITLVNLTPTRSGRAPRAFAVGDASGTARALGGDSGLRRFEADPATGGFVAVGPLPELEAEAGAPPARRPDTITALTVEP